MRTFLHTIVFTFVVFATSMQSAHAVNIAIVDTGLNPGVLGGVTGPDGYDFVNDDSDASDESSIFHGTAAGHVAVNSGSGISLTAIKTFQQATGTTSDILAAGFDYIATLPNVRVISHDGASISDTPIASLRANTSAGKIIVLQAGNFGGGSPAGDASKAANLDNLAIVAGGVTPSGDEIQRFSNRAGGLQDYFLMAQTNSLITSSNGTSMAVPRIAAAAATLLKEYGFLTGQQVVQILLNTATDLGKPGADSTYGHGVLNLAAALSAAGAGTIPTDSGSGSSGGGGVGAIALIVGGAAAYAFMNKKEELQRTVLVDAYGRAFQFNFDDRIRVRDTRPNLFNIMQDMKDDFETVVLESNKQGYTQAFIAEKDFRPFGLTTGDALVDQYVSFLHRTNTSDFQYALGLNSDLSNDFGALSLRTQKNKGDPPQFYMSDMLTTPVLGYSSMGSSFMYGWDKDTVNHRFGMSVINEQETNGQHSNSVLYESRIVQDNYRVGLQLGALLENGSFLGSANDSVLGVDQTNTYYVGFNGSYDLSDKVSLLGGYFQGLSDVDEGRNSLLGDVNGVRTEGFSVGVLIDDLFTPKGSFGFSYSSPLQTTDGSATLTLPVSQDYNTGAIGFESTDLSFSDGDQEKVFEAYYNYDISHKSSIFTHFSYTENPLSNLDASSDRTIFFGVKHRF